MRRSTIARLTLCMSFVCILGTQVSVPVVHARTPPKVAAYHAQTSASATHRKARRLGNLAASAWKMLGATSKPAKTVTRRVTKVAAVTLSARTPLPPVSSSSTQAASSSAAAVTASADEAEVLRLVNIERAKEDLPALVMNDRLHDAAIGYAQDMRSRNFFAHVDPDGRTPEDRIRASGYLDVPCNCGYRYRIGENIAKNQTSAAQVVREWMDSPDHRDNILNAYYLEIGVGRSGNYWVQEFGRMTNE